MKRELPSPLTNSKFGSLKLFSQQVIGKALHRAPSSLARLSRNVWIQSTSRSRQAGISTTQIMLVLSLLTDLSAEFTRFQLLDTDDFRKKIMKLAQLVTPEASDLSSWLLV